MSYIKIGISVFIVSLWFTFLTRVKLHVRQDRRHGRLMAGGGCVEATIELSRRTSYENGSDRLLCMVARGGGLGRAK
jgi:hypothetical protein